MNFPLAEQVATLVDEAEITRLLTRYAWCVDDKRWDDWAACFADDAAVTMPFAAHTGRKGLADWGRCALEPFETTHHMSTNFDIIVHGDTAEARSKFQAVHVPTASSPDQFFTESGTYHWGFVRDTGRGWLISACTLSVAWTAGNDDTGLAGH